jgi:hypothetical protein
MCPLVYKIGCIPLSEGGLKFETGRTFTGNGKQDYATWFFNVGYCEVPYKLHLMWLASNKESWVEC